MQLDAEQAERCAHAQVLLEWICSGTTVCACGWAEQRRGRSRRILASLEPPPSPVHVVYPEARLIPARTRVFIDFIKAHIATEQAAWRMSAARRK